MQGKTFVALFICVILFLFPLIAAAQEEGEEPAAETETEAVIEDDVIEEVEAVEGEAVEEAEEEPQGLGLLMFLLGIVGVLAVGGAAIGSDRLMAVVDDAAPSNQTT